MTTVNAFLSAFGSPRQIEFLKVNTAGNDPDIFRRGGKILDHVPADDLTDGDDQFPPSHHPAEQMGGIITMAGGQKMRLGLAAGKKSDPGRHPGTGMDNIDFFILDDRQPAWPYTDRL